MQDVTVDVAVYCHEPLKAPLLRAAVLPAMRELPDGVSAHAERGWLHGPHVRIRLRGASDDVERAATALAERFTAHLRRHPSRARLSRARLAELATAAGRAELVPPPYEPFVPDNTVRIEQRDAAALARLPGSPATAEVRDELLRLGVPAVEAMLADVGRHGDTAGARVRAVTTALAAHAAVGPGGLPNIHLSYRSHVEAYLHHHDPDGRVRAGHEAVWRQHGDELTALVNSQDGPDDGGIPAAAQWRRWGVEARAAGAAAYERGVLVSAAGADTSRRAAAFDDPALSRVYSGVDISAFHQRLVGWELDARSRRGFEIERFCVNTLYLLLAVADVTPAERYLSGSLVCAAVERLTGTTWQEKFDGSGPVALR